MSANTIEATLEGVAKWVEAAIAPKLRFRLPPEDGSVEEPSITRANPTVHTAFVPPAERLADGQRQAPSIAVQLLGGTDGLSGARTLDMRLVLTVWSPGRFENGRFVRSLDGWRDLYNGLDAMASAVEAADTVAGCTVDAKQGVRFGFLDVDGEIPDLFPFWVGKVDFTLQCGTPENKKYDDML